jgi:hypothetical protein
VLQGKGVCSQLGSLQQIRRKRHTKNLYYSQQRTTLQWREGVLEGGERTMLLLSQCMARGVAQLLLRDDGESGVHSAQLEV